MTMISKSKTHYAIPPGETIKEALENRNMTKEEFTVCMDMSETEAGELIEGKTKLTHDMAVRLEKTFGIDAVFWERLEAMYREDIRKVEAENAETVE